jgi:hypothetical protein
VPLSSDEKDHRGIAGLGLVAGAGSVAYNHNNKSATVHIRGANGQVQSVHIGFTGRQFSCPSGEHNKLNPLVIKAGRIKLSLKGVEADLRSVDEKYPSRKLLAHAPRGVIERFSAELERGKRLESAFNANADRYDAMIKADCTASSGGQPKPGRV